MSEKPPRRKKKEEIPESVPNPELERLIAQAPKGTESAPEKEAKPAESAKRILSRESDAEVNNQLDKLGPLEVNGKNSTEQREMEESPTEEEIQKDLDETATDSTKRTLDNFKNLLHKAELEGGGAISLVWVEKIGIAAAKRLGGEEFNEFKKYVVPKYELNEVKDISPELDFLRSGRHNPAREPKPERKEVPVAEVTNVRTEPLSTIDTKLDAKETVPENLPGSSPEELKEFEEGLIKSVEDWQKERKDVESPKSSQESTAESTDSNTIEDMSAPAERNLFEELTPENIYRAVKSRKLIEVKVKRSSGDVEDGWFVTGGDDKDIVVLKDIGGGKAITKIISLEELNDLNKVGVSRVAKAEPVLAPRVGGVVSEEEPVLTSEGAFFTQARKESLARDFGVDASIVSHEEVPEGTLLTPEQKKYLSELDVPMPAEERDGTWKPTTRAEWIQELRNSIFGEKNSEGKRERVESSRAYLTKRSEELGERAKEYGPKVLGAIGSVVERYNKLNWKTKLALTGTLMLGAAYMPVAAGAFTAALYGQRALGAIGVGMNRRKNLDAKIAANPEHWLAGKSELAKNAYVALLSAGYMAATSLAVHEGVVGLKAAANSEWLPNSVDWVKTTAQDGFEKIKESANTNWLGNMLGHENLQPASGTIETLVPTPEVPLDQVHTVQTLDPNLFAEAKDVNHLRVLADASFKHLTPNEQAVLDNHIASFTPRERYFFDQYSNDLSSKLGAPEAPLYNPEVDEHIAKAHEAIERMQKLVDEQAKILNSIPDGSETPTPDLPGPENIVPTPEEAPTVSGPDIPGAEEGPVQINPEPQAESSAMPGPEQSTLETPLAPEQAADAPFGRDPIDGHTMSEIEAQKLTDLRNAMHDPRETGAWPPGPPEEKGFFEKLFGSSDENPTETVGQFNIDSVFAAEPHIYSDAEGHLFAYGGSIEDKIESIQKFLTENPDKIVYGTDDSGNYRIPWSLYEGHALPGEPVRTSGFLGFFSSFMDAPKPEEFVKKIK